MNAGCRITTIQALLGHDRLNTTMTYAMAVIEERACPSGAAVEENGSACRELLALVAALEGSTVDEEQRVLVEEIRRGLLALAG